jgi:hypothetical protein
VLGVALELLHLVAVNALDQLTGRVLSVKAAIELEHVARKDAQRVGRAPA